MCFTSSFRKYFKVRVIGILLACAGPILLPVSCGRTGSLALGTDSVDYNLHIRPLLSDRCFKCHGPDANQRKAHLRLDKPESAYASLQDDSTHYVIVPGHPETSEVYRRITAGDTSEVMPPANSNLSLKPDEIELIGRWIEQGARYKPHWAFIPPKKSVMPEVDESEWPKNEIDYFALARMERLGLEPNPQADKEHLLKRLSFDLTGLPPTLEEQNAFLADDSEGAYEKMVDTYLAKPQYGEKMALHWMDLARYADSHGYQDDGLRTMWPWRDWVIHAFNENYSYEQFVTWQLAGDLLPQPTLEQRLATGFNRNHKITQEGGVIDEEYRIEYVTDRTNTFGKAFLALTFECAKCHDHKYDPIPQKDYYGTFAFFNQVPEKGLVGDISLASLADPPKIKITSEEVRDVLDFINKEDTASVEVMVMEDMPARRPTYTLKRGVYNAPGDRVFMHAPSSILPFDTVKYGASRLGLARWLFNPRNPLTARVFVNRIWQEVFGRGLVKTSGDFGMQGEMPSNPELLDWLAVDFMEHGWDIKRLMKQLVTSATYRQSAVVPPDKFEVDPENVLLARGPRTRMSAEVVRDMVLASSGLLNTDIGGPSVKTYQPDGIWEVATSGRGELSRYLQDHGDKLYRRGLYSFIKRTVPPPSMLTFDGSSRDQCEVRRLRTSTPLQALVLMNDPTVLEGSRVLAERILMMNLNDEKAIEYAFRSILCRTPKAEEVKLLQSYLQDETERFRTDPANAASFIAVGEHRHPDKEIPYQVAALMQVIHTIYNTEEAITKS